MGNCSAPLKRRLARRFKGEARDWNLTQRPPHRAPHWLLDHRIVDISGTSQIRRQLPNVFAARPSFFVELWRPSNHAAPSLARQPGSLRGAALGAPPGHLHLLGRWLGCGRLRGAGGAARHRRHQQQPVPAAQHAAQVGLARRPVHGQLRHRGHDGHEARVRRGRLRRPALLRERPARGADG
eukprot:scaffold106_cov246-Pinguiococcus_pyrenoidosus.AAC.12